MFVNLNYLGTFVKHIFWFIWWSGSWGSGLCISNKLSGDLLLVLVTRSLGMGHGLWIGIGLGSEGSSPCWDGHKLIRIKEGCLQCGPRAESVLLSGRHNGLDMLLHRNLREDGSIRIKEKSKGCSSNYFPIIWWNYQTAVLKKINFPLRKQTRIRFV